MRGIETPGIHGEHCIPRDVAEDLRNVERHKGPEELADTKPRVTEATRMEGLNHDDRSPGDASRFCQHAGRLVRVGEHEQEKRSRERSLFERKDSVYDHDGA